MGQLTHTHRRHAAGPPVEPATLADVPAIAAINRQFHMPIRGFPYDTQKWIAEEVREGNYYVIRDQQGIAGAVCVPVDRDSGVIETMAVRADLHGLGLGRVLVEHAIKLSLDSGARELHVGSFCKYGVKGFYESCGFECLGTFVGPSGKPYYDFTMPLDPPGQHHAPQPQARIPAHG